MTDDAAWTPALLYQLRWVDWAWQQRVDGLTRELENLRASYLDSLADERAKQVEVALEASEKALVLATEELKERLKLLNELRGNVVDKTAFDAYADQQDERYQQILRAIGELRTDVAVGPSAIPALQNADAQRMGSERGRQQQSTHTLAIIIASAAVAGVALTVVGLFLTAVTIIVSLAASGNL